MYTLITIAVSKHPFSAISAEQSRGIQAFIPSERLNYHVMRQSPYISLEEPFGVRLTQLEHISRR